ncbi:MAG TPA: type II secretion system protein [Rhodocyclaceae bacterium]|nr:type II secretion system protein [Rhodocyclaceae bacterium]
MHSTFRKPDQSGFTLVELLIVVIILAILAAIVIPQFSGASTDAKESALDADLSALRSAIELYKVQHGGNYPGSGATTAASIACSGTAGTTASGTPQAWMDDLLMASDAAGNTCSVSDATTYRYGPYLRKGIPPDPITGNGAAVADIAVTTTGAPLTPAAATGGWAVDTVSGQIVMNSKDHDSHDKAYSSH